MRVRKSLLVTLIISFFVLLSIYSYTNGVQMVNSIINSQEHDIITVHTGEAIVFSFPKQVENVTFSKTSGFTLRTLEGGEWIDMSNNISDYYPLRGYLVRNFGDGDLVINVTYEIITKAEDAIFQKTLNAGWNLIGIASKDSDSGGLVLARYGLGESLPYSQLVDFSPEGIIKKEGIENEIYIKDTYSGEVEISQGNAGIRDHRVNSEYIKIKNKSELQGESYLYEKLAYGIFVNNDTVISGSQDTSSYSSTGTTTEVYDYNINYDSKNNNLTIQAIDTLGTVIEDFAGTINISSGTSGLLLTGELADNVYNFSPEDQGVATFANSILVDEIGIYKIIVSDDINNINKTYYLNIKPNKTVLTLVDKEVYEEQEDIITDKFYIINDKYNNFTINEVKVRVCQVVSGTNGDSYDCDDNLNTSDIKVFKGYTSTGELLGQTSYIDPDGYATISFNETMEFNSLKDFIITITPRSTNSQIDITGKKYVIYHTDIKYSNSNGLITWENNDDLLLGLLGELDRMGYGRITILANSALNNININVDNNGIITADPLDSSNNIIPNFNGTLVFSTTSDGLSFTGELIDNQYIFNTSSDWAITLFGSAVIEKSLLFDEIGNYNLTVTEQNSGISNTFNFSIFPNISTNVMVEKQVTIGSTDVVSENIVVANDTNTNFDITNIEVYTKVYTASGSEFTIGNATINEVSKVSLYLDTVSTGTLLGSTTSITDGVASINLNQTVNSNSTSNILITIDIANNETIVGKSLSAVYKRFLYENSKGENIQNEDDLLHGLLIGLDNSNGGHITVIGLGELILTEDNNNEDNQDNKIILAGSSETVFSVDVQSINEPVDVETVMFTVDGATALANSITNASLYLGNQLIDTNTNSDITNTTITFDNLTNLTVEEITSELKLVFNTETIGYQKVGATDRGITITNVSLKDALNAEPASLAVTSQTIDIVPAILIPSVTTSLNSSATPEIRITSNVGGNTIDTFNSGANVLVDTITLSTLGTSSAGALTYTLTNVDDSSDIVTGVPGAGYTLVFDLSTMTDTNKTVSSSVSETFKVTITGTAEGDTVSLTLLEDGIVYDVLGTANSNGLTTNMTNELDLGSRSY